MPIELPRNRSKARLVTGGSDARRARSSDFAAPFKEVSRAAEETSEFLFGMADQQIEARRRARVVEKTGGALQRLNDLELEFERDTDYETAPRRYIDRVKEIRDEITEDIEDEDVRLPVLEDFNQGAQSGSARLKRRWWTQEVDAKSAQLGGQLIDYADNAAKADNEIDRQRVFGLGERAIGEMQTAGYISAQRAQQLQQALRDDVAAKVNQRRRDQANQLIINDPDQAAAALEAGAFEGLRETDRLSLLKEAKVQQRIAANERKREVAERRALLRGRVSSALKDELASRRRSGKSAGLVSEDIIRQAYEPDDADAILQQLDDETAFFETRQQIALSPVSEDIAILQANAPAGEGFAAEAERQDMLIAAVKDKRKALAEDPAGYLYRQSPGLAAAIEAAETPLDTRAAIDVLLTEQERIGVPRHARRALSNGQASGLAESYVGLSDAQARADWVRARAEAYGEHWPKVYGELAAAGLPPGAIVLAGMTGPDQARAVVLLAEAQEEGAKGLKDALGAEEAGLVEDAVRAELAAFHESLARVPLGTETQNLYRDQVTLLAYAYRRRGGDAASAAARAAADVVNSQYSFHGTFRVPREFDGAEAEQRLESYRRVGLAPLDLELPPIPGLEAAEVKRQYLDHLAEYGYWITNPDETGVWLFEGTDKPVMQRKPSPAVSDADLKRLNMSPQERRIVDYHRNSIETGTAGRDEQGRPVTVFSTGIRVPRGPHEGKFVSVPGWVDGRILSEQEAYEHWRAEIDAGQWPLYESGEALNRRSRQIHSVMDAESGELVPVELLFDKLPDFAPPPAVLEGASP